MAKRARTSKTDKWIREGRGSGIDSDVHLLVNDYTHSIN